MKTVGIIGGLGPETTAKFYLELVFLCQKNSTVARPPILISSVPIHYEMERNEILNGILEEGAASLLIDSAQKLEKSGADFLVMPCNSLSVFIERIRKSVDIPVLSIIDVTARFLKEKKITRVGILSTAVTRNMKLYDGPLGRYGIKVETVDDDQQTELNKTILNLICNSYTQEDKERLENAISGFVKKGVNDIVLACTDLQLLPIDNPRVNIYDTMKIFAKATVDIILR